MEKDVIVAVCMITYNHEKYIAEAIESIVTQKTTFKFKLYISDDCSTDETTKIIKNYYQRYPHIIDYVKHPVNKGMLNNLYFTLQKCYDSGAKFIAVCEGDDFWTDKLKLHTQYLEMEKHPHCSMCIHPALVYSQKRSYVKWSKSNEKKVFTIHDIIKEPGQFAPTASYFFKASIFSILPIWFCNAPVGDFFLEVYSALKGDLLFLPQSMSAYRVNISSSWTGKTLSNIKSTKMLNYYEEMDKYLKFIKEETNVNFNSKLAAVIYGKSLYYLANEHYSEFKVLIKESYNISRISYLQIALFRMRYLGVVSKYTYLFKVYLDNVKK